MMRTSLLATLGLGLVGCLGPLPPNNNTSPDAGHSGSNTETARQMFDGTVAPLLSACSGCHVGNETSTTDMFLGPPPASNDSFYAGITNDRRVNGNFDPASAELLTKGAHSGVTWWNAQQQQTITAWLEAEAAERGSGDGSDVVPVGSGSNTPTTGATSSTEEEQDWASCLSVSLADYNSTKVYEIANMISSQGTCYSCHEPGGAGGAYWGIDNDYQTMLHKWQEAVFITGPFEVGVKATTPVTYTMISGREKICNKGTEQDRNAGTHPAFDCNQQVGGVNAMDALDAFTAAVQAKQAAGSCPTPGAFAPPD